MGFKRFVKKSFIPGYWAKNIIENIATFGVVDGLKEEFKETYLEDTPGLSHIYNAGKHEGKKEGYAQSSHEYEKKLLKQAEKFLNQQKNFNQQRDEYEQLINEYELYIEEMNTKELLTSEEEIYLNKIMIMERNLKKLK